MKTHYVTLALLIAMNVAHAQSNAIRVASSGKGKPVIFLPGYTTPGSVWDETIENLKGKNEIHVVSYAGFNGIRPIEMPWYEAIRKELLTYILVNNLRDIRIIGHSMGGNLAADIASEIPQQIESLVLVDAIPCMRELMMPGVSADQLVYDNPYSRQMLEMSEEKFRENALMMSQQMTLKKDKVDTLVSWSLRADRQTYVYGFTDLLKLDLRPSLSRITAKTLILGAPFPDKAVVTENFEKQYANLKNKTIEIAPESRHFIMFDQPIWFFEKVNNFLNP
jgi:pimeloyl-ACP methyl ester carboxylesterase